MFISNDTWEKLKRNMYDRCTDKLGILHMNILNVTMNLEKVDL